jgi:hypothetical protein
MRAVSALALTGGATTGGGQVLALPGHPLKDGARDRLRREVEALGAHGGQEHDLVRRCIISVLSSHTHGGLEPQGKQPVFRQDWFICSQCPLQSPLSKREPGQTLLQRSFLSWQKLAQMKMLFLRVVLTIPLLAVSYGHATAQKSRAIVGLKRFAGFASRTLSYATTSPVER